MIEQEILNTCSNLEDLCTAHDVHVERELDAQYMYRDRLIVALINAGVTRFDIERAIRDGLVIGLPFMAPLLVAQALGEWSIAGIMKQRNM